MKYKKPFKKASALLLTVALTFSSFSDIGSAEPKFSDIKNHWAESFIKDLVDKGVINGYSDGTIRPNNNITRAEFAKTLAVSMDLDIKKTTRGASSFNDIEGSFANDYIETLVRLGAINPKDIGKSFKPNEQATRLFQMELIVNSIGKQELAKTMTGKTPFKDDSELSNKDRGIVNVSNKYKITSGYGDKTVRPYIKSTRAQSFALIQRRQVAIDEIAKENAHAKVVIEVPKASDTETSFDVKATLTDVKSITWSILDKDSQKQVDSKLVEGKLTGYGGKIRIKEKGSYVVVAKAVGISGKTDTFTKNIEIGLKPTIEIVAEGRSIVGQPINVKTILTNIDKDEKLKWILLLDGKEVNWSDYIIGTLSNGGGTISFKQKGAFTLKVMGAISNAQAYTAQSFVTVTQPSSPSYPQSKVEIETPAYSHTDTFFVVTSKQEHVNSMKWTVVKKEDEKSADELKDKKVKAEDSSSSLPSYVEGSFTKEGGEIKIRESGEYIITAEATSQGGQKTKFQSIIHICDVPKWNINLPKQQHAAAPFDIKVKDAKHINDNIIDWSISKVVESPLEEENGIDTDVPITRTEGKIAKENDKIVSELNNDGGIVTISEVGQYVLTATIIDEHKRTFVTTDTIEITNEAPTKPELKHEVTRTFKDGKFLVPITFESTDSDGDNITYVFEGKTEDDYYGLGEHTVKVRALDGFGGVSEWAETTFTVINNAPAKPTISADVTKDYKEGQFLVSLKVNSKDPDDDDFTFEYEDKANNDRYAVGKHKVKVRAVDEFGFASEWAEVTFEVINTAPTNPVLEAKVTRTFKDGKFHVPIIYSSIDAEGDEVKYEFEGRSEDDYYPVGKHKVKVRALDPYDSVSEWSEVTFDVINHAPDTPTINADVTKDYKDGRFLVPLTVSSNDPEEDDFTFEYEGKADDNRYAVGKHTVKVRAVDEFGFGSAWGEVTFDVINTAPTVPVVKATVTRTFIDGKFFVPITFTSTDAEGDNVEYEFKGRSEDDYYELGTHTLKVRALDPYEGVSDWGEVTFDVVNAAPTKPVVNYEITRDYANGKFKVPITFSSTDIEGDTIFFEFEGRDAEDRYAVGKHTVRVRGVDPFGGESEWTEIQFELKNADPTVPTITADVTREYKEGKFKVPVKVGGSTDEDGDKIMYEFEGKADDDFYGLGEHTVKVRAKDDYDGVSDWSEVSFNVSNSAPSDVSISADVTRTYKNGKFYVPIKVSATDDDNTVDEIQFEYKNKAEDDYYPEGTHTVSARAYDPFDGYSDWVDTTFTIRNAAPEKPVFSFNVTREYKNGKFKVPITYSSTDPDGDEISYEFEGKAEDDFYSLGEHTVKVRAKDNYDGVSEWSEVTFTVRNFAPITPTVNVTTTRDFVNGKALVNVSYSSTDADGDAIEYEVQGKTSDNRYAVGTHTIRVRAKDAYDGASEWVDKQFTIVNTAPTTPVISRNPSGNSIAPGTAVRITGNSTDADGDPIRYVWENRPSESYVYGIGKQVVRVKAIDSADEESPWAAIVFFVADSNGNGGAILNGPNSTINENGIDGATITSYTFTVPPVDGHSSSADYGSVRGYNVKTNTWDQLNHQPTTNGVTLTGTVPAGTYSKLEFYYYTDHDCMYGKSNITYSVDYFFD